MLNEAGKFFINFIRSFLFYIQYKILCCTERCSTKYSCRHRASARYKRYSKRFLNNACIRISQVYSFLAWRGKCVWQWTIRLLFPLLTHGLTVDRVFFSCNFQCMHYFFYSDRCKLAKRCKNRLGYSTRYSFELSFTFCKTIHTMYLNFWTIKNSND